ncbi:MAG TPA: SdrD B-like domain-containing protein, partial [Rhodothermales bacterium]|nr:SdrD B-like domain-containing protein [Rhodothermales bacterium]
MPVVTNIIVMKRMLRACNKTILTAEGSSIMLFRHSSYQDHSSTVYRPMHMFERCVSRLGAGIFSFAAFTMLLVSPQGLLAQEQTLQDVGGDPTPKVALAKPLVFEDLVVPEPMFSNAIDGVSEVADKPNSGQNVLFTNVTGFVYNDYNSNGVKDTYDIGVPGVLVSAYGSNGSLITSTTTNASGSYSLSVSSGTQVRIEFTQIPAGSYPTNAGTGNGTTVQFATAPASNVNLGINYPADYCENNPKMATPFYVNGNPLAGGTAGGANAFWTYNYSDIDYSTPTATTTANRIGATWGVAYQRESFPDSRRNSGGVEAG